KCADDIGRSSVVADKGAGLEQVGSAIAQRVDAEVGAAAGEREARDRVRREAVVGTNSGTVDAAACVVRAERNGIAIGPLRSSIAGGPHTPALLKGRCNGRRLGVDGRIRIAFTPGAVLRSVSEVFLGIARRAATSAKTIA